MQFIKKVKIMRKLLLVLLLLLLLLSACSTNKTNSSANSDDQSSNQMMDASKSDSDISTSSGKDETKSTEDETSSPEKAFKAVLQNKISFNSINYYKDGDLEDNQEIYLNDYITKYFENNIKIVHITLIDLDGDQTPELILEFSQDDGYSVYPMSYEVLHYNNGKVYGYEFPFRAFEYLKEDGTYSYASSSDDDGVGKIVNFSLTEAEDESLAYRKIDEYTINNAPVNKEDYDAYFDQQDVKQGVQWYEFSVEKFEELWSAG